jgi:hypothetical protein
VPKSKPKCMTIGGRQPLNRFSDKIRAEVLWHFADVPLSVHQLIFTEKTFGRLHELVIWRCSHSSCLHMKKTLTC